MIKQKLEDTQRSANNLNLSANDHHIDAILSKGIIALQKQNLSQAKKCFEEAMLIAPDSASPYYHLGLIFHQLAQYQKAAKAFQRALEIDPKHTDAMLGLSVLYNDIGDYEKGKKLFKRAQDNLVFSDQEQEIKDPHIDHFFSDKHYEMAELYMTHQRFNSAMIEIEKAINLSPSFKNLYLMKAKIFSKMGETPKSIEILKNIKVSFPKDTDARMGLGIIYYSLGKIDLAQKEWQSICVIDPKHTKAKSYLKISENATEISLQAEEK